MIDPQLVDVFKSIVLEIYKDGFSPTVKEFGARLLSFVTKFRLRRDREVPPEFRTQPPTIVAGPTAETVRFVDDNTVMQECFLNLMLKAIDTRHQADAHNAYPQIIAALSPIEAFLLYDLFEKGGILSEQISVNVAEPTEAVVNKHLPQYSYLSKDQLYSAIDHLAGLKLIDESETRVGGFRIDNSDWRVYLGITHFGRQFINVCLPSKERVEEIRKQAEAKANE